MRSVGYLITAIIAVIAGPRVGILPLLFLRMEPAAATVRTGFQDQLVGELKVDQPIELAFLPDGRMLVASQGGKLWVGSATDPEDPRCRTNH
jgi:hypothetical protein